MLLIIAYAKTVHHKVYITLHSFDDGPEVKTAIPGNNIRQGTTRTSHISYLSDSSSVKEVGSKAQVSYKSLPDLERSREVVEVSPHD